MNAPLLVRAELAPRKGPRIRIFNVKYSPNLGDGLLSECLEQALIDCGADRDTWSIDLAARTSYGAGSPARALQMRLLEQLPSPVRSLAVRAPLAVQSRRRWAPHYDQSLDGAECVVIGGGNLLADLDLNFPTKISLALEAASRRQLPVFIYGCGVSAGWSRQGREMLRTAVRGGAVRKVWVRDERSRRVWNELIGREAGLEAAVTRDPGLLAAVRYKAGKARPPSATPLIGLNITSPVAVRYHSRNAPQPGELDRWYVEFARVLLGGGCRLAVFSNGSPEDREYIRKLRPSFEALNRDQRIAFPEPGSPSALTALIGGCEAVAAFRMHAIIAAYSCGVPFLALAWDPKVEAFVRSVNLPRWLCVPRETSAPEALRKLSRAMEEGIHSGQRATFVDEARRGVEDLYDEMISALARA